MIKTKSKNNKFYYMQCGDWEAVTVANSHREACSSAVSQAIDMFKDSTKFTNVIVCSDCQKSLDADDNNIEAFHVETILEEIYEH